MTDYMVDYIPEVKHTKLIVVQLSQEKYIAAQSFLTLFTPLKQNIHANNEKSSAPKVFLKYRFNWMFCSFHVVCAYIFCFSILLICWPFINLTQQIVAPCYQQNQDPCNYSSLNLFLMFPYLIHISHYFLSGYCKKPCESCTTRGCKEKRNEVL